MIQQVELTNFGPIAHLKFEDLGAINLIIGTNGAGKTFLLKSVYASIKALEQNGRGKEPRSIKELLVDKLYWTFQADPIGNLVKKGTGELNYSMSSSKNESFQFSFGKDTSKSIANLQNSFEKRESNSIFIPSKEVLSLQTIIQKSRNRDKEFGFDDTYYDLANALLPRSQGRNRKSFSNARKQLSDAIGGIIEFNKDKNEWMFHDINRKEFSISLTSEGIKKVSILDALLGNHTLDRDSIIFIDEPEAALHPELISKFLDIIAILANDGLQFFIATHSYFVIKKLYLIANQKKGMPIPVISFEAEDPKQYDLSKGMPENPIIRESIRLYEEEIDL